MLNNQTMTPLLNGKNWVYMLVVRACLLFIVWTFFVEPAESKALRVAVSSNFAGSLEQLLALPDFKHINVVSSEGSTGALYAQIARGAPFDVFLSADTYYVDKLVENDKVIKSQTGIYTIGRLAYIDRILTQPSLNSLKTYALAANTKIAIADPDIAPYGKAAEQFLSTLSLWQQVLPSLVYGRNVLQAFNYYETQYVDRAIVAYSLVANRQEHVWLVPDEYHQPILQKWAIIKGSNHPRAKRFIELLLSKPVQTVLHQQGYDPIE